MGETVTFKGPKPENGNVFHASNSYHLISVLCLCVTILEGHVLGRWGKKRRGKSGTPFYCGQWSVRQRYPRTGWLKKERVKSLSTNYTITTGPAQLLTIHQQSKEREKSGTNTCSPHQSLVWLGWWHVSKRKFFVGWWCFWRPWW